MAASRAPTLKTSKNKLTAKKDEDNFETAEYALAA